MDIKPIAVKAVNAEREKQTPVERIRALEATVFGTRLAPAPATPARPGVSAGMKSTAIR